jgi:hypothetical protein
VEQLDERARSRRRFLAVGAGLIGVAAVARVRVVARTVMPAAATAFRPEARTGGGSASVCGTCGRTDHSMLGGACLPRRMRG